MEGLTEDEMRNLANPKGEDYDAKTFSAIRYAREWALTRGEVADAEVIAEFEKQYPPKEREALIGLIRIMDFSNRVNNTWTRPLNKDKLF